MCLSYFSLVKLFSKVMRECAHKPSICLASLVIFTEFKPPVPQTLRSKPRHMHVTFQGNLRGINGMKDRSRVFGMGQLRLEVKNQKYCICPPSLLGQVSGQKRGQVSYVSGCVCILDVAVEWPLGGKERDLVGLSAKCPTARSGPAPQAAHAVVAFR